MNATEIRTMRLTLGLNQRELGELVHARYETVSRWENGRLAPDEYQASILAALARRAERMKGHAVESTIRDVATAKMHLKSNDVGRALAVIL